MSLAIFLALLVRSRILSVALIAWSLVNCYTRMYLGLHYPLDILCGIVWGVAVAFAVYWLFYVRIYRRISCKITYISTQYTSTGYSLLDINMVVNILVLTFVAALIYSLL